MNKSANYRTAIALGTGTDGEQFMSKCNALCEKLKLMNVRGEANYSALFRRAVEALSEKLGVK